MLKRQPRFFHVALQRHDSPNAARAAAGFHGFYVMGMGNLGFASVALWRRHVVVPGNSTSCFRTGCVMFFVGSSRSNYE